MGEGIRLQIQDAHGTNYGPEQPDGMRHCPTWQCTACGPLGVMPWQSCAICQEMQVLDCIIGSYICMVVEDTFLCNSSTKGYPLAALAHWWLPCVQLHFSLFLFFFCFYSFSIFIKVAFYSTPEYCVFKWAHMWMWLSNSFISVVIGNPGLCNDKEVTLQSLSVSKVWKCV